MKTQKNREKGQILILFVFGLVGLLAFTALAIDGGMVYADRRYDQSVADAAALAGIQAAEKVLHQRSLIYGDFTCDPSDPDYADMYAAMTAAIDAAVDRANANLPANDVFPDVFNADLTDQMGVEVICEPQTPSSPPDPLEERYLDVHVMVASETRTSFAHLFLFRNRIRNVVNSTARLMPAIPIAFGNAIVSLNETYPCNGSASEGMVFDGGGNNETSVNIDGGGVYSNSCITRNGKFSVDVTDGSVLHLSPLPDGYVDNGTSGAIVPAPQPAPEPITIDEIWPVACGPVKTMSDAVVVGSTSILQPGTYNGGISINNGDWGFEEGLYCLNGDLKINGGNVTGGCTKQEYLNGTGGPTGTCDSGGVTFYIQPDSNNNQPGGVTINGGAIVNLFAPLDPDANPEIKGMLIYMPENNPGVISIEGSALSAFRGTILAPTGDVAISGTPQTSADFAVQIIGLDVSIGGSASLNITYDSESTVVYPAKGSQEK